MSIYNRNKWQTGKVLESFDSFGEPVPGFNIKGQDSVKTRIGGVLTLIISATVLLYAVVKFTHLYTKHNPLFSSYLVDIDEKETLNLSEEPDFRFAVTIESYMAPR